jgi:hypothetical protein
MLTIAQVVADFRAALPDAAIWVYDNNSTDDTARIAAGAGALVRSERRQGKGHVIRRAFADIEADIYVLVDGDATYSAAAAPDMLTLLRSGPFDMVTAARNDTGDSAYRPGHRFGNRLLTRLVAAIFGAPSTDMLTGYRALSRRYVKSFPAASTGFEVETELTVHAQELRMPVGEVVAAYGERPAGSLSKLRTVQDGVQILRTILALLTDQRPLAVFGFSAAALFCAGIGLGSGVVVEFTRTGLVPRLPTAVLASALVMLAALSAACGLILDSVAGGRREVKRLAYLVHPAPGASNSPAAPCPRD